MSDTTRVRALDVSGLPDNALDHTAPVWWGNLMLIAIETMMFALLVAAWFYVRRNITPWPPVRAIGEHVRWDTDPALWVPTIGLAVLLLSCIPAAHADKAAHRMDRRGVVRWLSLALGAGLVAVVLRLFEFGSLGMRWDENAYGSVVWAILGMHLLHLLVMVLEGVTSLVWVATKSMEKRRALDVRVSTVYWYWVAGVWVPLYVIVYLLPRLL